VYVDDTKKLVFLAQPHCASRSIAKLMTDQRTPPPEWHGRRVGTHHSVDLEMLGELKMHGYKAFTVVRNHYDWVVSAFGNIKPREPFGTWLQKFIDRDSYVYRGPWGHCRAFWQHYDPADIVLRYETLNEGMAQLYDADLPHIGASKRGVYQDYHTDATRHIMARHFGIEMRALGYSYE